MIDLIISGFASYYTTTGCLGCNKNLTMANGERLNDSAYTVALTPKLYRKYKNQYVIIINSKTKQEVKCKVTDTGGFMKYNRVADLSKACAEAINLKTDKSFLYIFKN
jgi:rare lipoprotein A (peptidoglycan hydrolase)